MHLTRAKAIKKLPITRKGTKYVARPMSHVNNSVPVVIALRDMLKLAGTTKEVKGMIKQKLIKINGREVKDYRDSIKLFNVLGAGKSYMLTLTKNRRFKLEETKLEERLCKVTDKTIQKGKKIQINLHDGSSVLSDEKINTQDTVYLDYAGKIKKHVPFEKGKDCFIFSGKYMGSKGKVESVEAGLAKIKLNDKTVFLEKGGVIVL